jgi:hypothetical protein
MEISIWFMIKRENNQCMIYCTLGGRAIVSVPVTTFSPREPLILLSYTT